MREYLNKDKVIEAITEANVIVVGMRFSKCILKQYAEKIREALVNAVEGVEVEEDLAPVRHGHWIVIGKTEAGCNILKCSDCGRERKGSGKSAYCRDCGAKMDLPTMYDFTI